MPEPYAFWKGHGTENDFVLLPDPDGTVHGGLDEADWAARVRALCDRRAGLGADGVLRVVRAAHVPDAAGHDPAGEAEWFMDYRNADGSLSEMCGNGVRVFAMYLLDAGLAPAGESIAVGTRAGVRTVVADKRRGHLSVLMGEPRVLGPTTVGLGGREWTATHVDVGNPHAVVLLDDDADAADLAALDLTVAPSHDPDLFPDGVNVELVVRHGGRDGRELTMRVHERGSGETRSCGTGACAVQAAVATADAPEHPFPSTHHVRVPGGELVVSWLDDGRSCLRGPAVLVAGGTTAL